MRPATSTGGLQPHLLQEEDDPLHHVGPLLLQAEERAWRPDEDLGFAIGRVLAEAAAFQELLHGLFVRGQVVVWPRELGDHFVPAAETERQRGHASFWLALGLSAVQLLPQYCPSLLLSRTIFSTDHRTSKVEIKMAPGCSNSHVCS